MALTDRQRVVRVVEIGSRYTGRHEGFADTRTGEYWESLPPITEDNLRIQQALLYNRPFQVRWPRSSR